MIATTSVTAANPQGAADKAKGAGFNRLGKNDFLNLLVQQVQHQDPLNPMNSTDFTAQLAQFSQLEQLTQVNDKLSELKLYQASINNAQAISLIGKDIKVKGNQVALKKGQPVKLGYSLGREASSVTITVSDGTGQQVATLVAGNQKAGFNEMNWNGKDTDGNQLPEGTYTFEVVAKDNEGDRVNSSTYVLGKVKGVEFTNSKPYLTTDYGKYAMSDVISVHADGEEQSLSSQTDTPVTDETETTQNG